MRCAEHGQDILQIESRRIVYFDAVLAEAHGRQRSTDAASAAGDVNPNKAMMVIERCSGLLTAGALLTLPQVCPRFRVIVMAQDTQQCS